MKTEHQIFSNTLFSLYCFCICSLRTGELTFAYVHASYTGKITLETNKNASFHLSCNETNTNSILDLYKKKNEKI